jgi:hypothetical protein
MKDRDGVVRKLALAGVIISDAALSYSILHARADHIGFAAWATWLYPVGLDALIVGASRTWQNADLSQSTRRLARWTTLLSVAFGMAGFIAEFYPRGWSAVAYSLFVPASLAAALILTSRAAADRKANAAQTQDQPVTQELEGDDDVEPYVPAEQQPETDRVTDFDIAQAFGVPLHLIDGKTIPGDATVHVSPARDDARGEVRATVTPPADDAVLSGDEPASPETRKQWIRDQLATGKNVTGADVDRQFPGGSRNGARLVRQVKEERGSRA